MIVVGTTRGISCRQVARETGLWLFTLLVQAREMSTFLGVVEARDEEARVYAPRVVAGAAQLVLPWVCWLQHEKGESKKRAIESRALGFKRPVCGPPSCVGPPLGAGVRGQ